MVSHRESLAALFHSYHRRLVGYAARVLRSRDRAEDIAQDAYVGLLSCGDVAEPRGYLFASAHNLAVDRLRRDRTEAVSESGLPPELADDAPSAEAIISSRERLLALQTALDTLPPATREAFLLSRLDGLPHREIAARLGVSVSMVEKHVMRALTHLRYHLRPEP
jgi:RNA polymerase sigma-70 factor (ECF subfamily)